MLARVGDVSHISPYASSQVAGDGSVRVYDSTSLKVLKAIQGLGDEVASIVCCPKPDQVLDNIYISVGCRVCLDLSRLEVN